MTLIDEFVNLLDRNENEESYQQFLEKHTELIPTGSFLLNHFTHFSLAFSQMHIHSTYISDFFIISKSSAKWHFIFIELEKPNANIFNKDGSYSSSLNKGIAQINDWRQYFSEIVNQESFKKNPVINKIVNYNNLYRNPFLFKYILVIGRRKFLENNDQLQRWSSLNQDPDLNVMTYDSLYESLNQKSKRYLCHVKKEYLYIDNEHVLDSDKKLGIPLFTNTDCNRIRIKQSFYDEVCQLEKQHKSLKVLSEYGFLGENTEAKLERLKNNIYT